eukprot:COSAG02_NODE_505_length_20935_cov_38.509119_13_plen_64_part_00
MSGSAPASATDLSEFARLTECRRAAAPASGATLYNICCTICSLQNVEKLGPSGTEDGKESIEL